MAGSGGSLRKERRKERGKKRRSQRKGNKDRKGSEKEGGGLGRRQKIGNKKRGRQRIGIKDGKGSGEKRMGRWRGKGKRGERGIGRGEGEAISKVLLRERVASTTGNYPGRPIMPPRELFFFQRLFFFLSFFLFSCSYFLFSSSFFLFVVLSVESWNHYHFLRS